MSTWYMDADGDGHGDAAMPMESCDAVEGYVDSWDDCDDAQPTSFPARTSCAMPSTMTATATSTTA